MDFNSPMTAQPDNDCHSEAFVSKMDPSYLSKGPEANRINADERKQALKELARRKRFEMHNVGGRPPKE